MKKLLRFLDGASLCALIVAMCSQVDVRRVGRDTLAEGLGYATKTLAVALSDVVFLLVALYFVARVIQLRAWKRLWWPPLACFALIFALILSALHSGSVVNAVAASIAEHGFGPRALITKESKEVLAEIAQWSAYFLVAPWLFVNLLHDRRELGERELGENERVVSRRSLAIGAFTFAVMASGIAALWQLQSFTASAPRGFFGSANVYGAFLALAIPLLLENESSDTRVQIRSWMLSLVLLFVALWTVVSVWAFAAAAIGLVFVVLARRGNVRLKAFRLCLVAALAVLTLGLWRAPSALVPFRADSVRLSSEKQRVKKQFIEWQAALGWSVPRERAFATGVGPGNYQLNIGPLYNSLPNEEKMPPDSNNLYLVQGVSVGILGLGALLWVLGHFWALAWRAAKKFPDDWLGAGVVGALSSWLFVNTFHALIVRGAGLVLAFLFALAVIASHGEKSEAGRNDLAA
ncbi:hypothetical protein B1R32_11741 [Abditibacterium utsteinense]|uniref:O-antigen ligase n=1 Tax=Abditibacterium utsteinense TaxID=1960156 RepID=A0A2S8SQH0_9BACT|nr:hypothetical protein [Abditibacterium utsteinense]PQV62999.1 hypothetical protein B1R32_11741 [Abditibacterium utsteinense]